MSRWFLTCFIEPHCNRLDTASDRCSASRERKIGNRAVTPGRISGILIKQLLIIISRSILVIRERILPVEWNNRVRGERKKVFTFETVKIGSRLGSKCFLKNVKLSWKIAYRCTHYETSYSSNRVNRE